MRWAKRRTITPARRGQIIQRIIVDGWSSEEAAAAFDVEPWLLDAWIADYRRRGMASLRQTPKHSIAAGMIRRSLSEPARAALRRVFSALQRWLAGDGGAPVSPQRRSRDDRGGL